MARGKYRAFAELPPERVPPFLLVLPPNSLGLVLIAPFRKRKSGPSPQEVALVRAVAGRLVGNLPAGPCWVDPRDGSMTPAAIGADQVRRRLIDDASFDVRMPT